MAGKAGRGRAVTRRTANVFADLRFPDAVERQVKLRLAYALNQLLAGRQLSLFEGVKVLDITQRQGRRFVATSWRTSLSNAL